MSKDIQLSVIMPVFNEEEHLSAAIESVLWQRVNFPFEILIVDDASTDGTYAVACDYAERFPDIFTILRNDRNMGKGYGFMRAYEAAQGKYFHVLDGDDYFLNFNKLQIQKDFLDGHDDFFAVCHNSVRVFPDGKIMLENVRKHEEIFDYESCIRKKFYAHTSTYMYRKIGKSLPKYFLKEPMRGDDGCFIYHAFQTKGKVKYLPMIGSVYNFHEQGIWTSLSSQESAQLRLDFFDIVLDDVIGDPRRYEYYLVDEGRDWARKSLEKPRVERRRKNTANHILTYCKRVSNVVFRPKVREKIFLGTHSLKNVDSLCEAIGGILRSKKKIIFGQREFKDKTVAIMISGLVVTGGGIVREVKELVSIYLDEGWDVHVLCTNEVKTAPDVLESYFGQEGVSFWHLPSEGLPVERVELLLDKLYELAPAQLYPFISHNDIVQNAALQRGLAGKVIMDYVYDHGTSLGIYNSAIDFFIAKSAPQAAALAQCLGKDRVLFIPPFLKDKYDGNPYQSPEKNGVINTACAAARDYKLESVSRYNYADVVCHILTITGGIHYHYGPLSEKFLTFLAKKMIEKQLPLRRFVHIEWADDFSGNLLEKSVHLFVAPFPVCSARIAIEVMSAGIPILNHVSSEVSLPQSHDFTGNDQLVWHDYFDLHEILVSLNPRKLSALSKNARLYYESYNEHEKCKKRFLNRQGYPYSDDVHGDIELHDVDDINYYEYDEFLYSLAAEKAEEEERLVANDDNNHSLPHKTDKKMKRLRRKILFMIKRRTYLILLILVSLVYLLPWVPRWAGKKRILQKVIRKIDKYF